MARVHGVHMRKPPKGPSSYTSKEAALAASPTLLVADAAFPKNKLESVKNAAFRVNSGGRTEWAPGEFFAIWEYARDVVLRLPPKEKPEEPEVKPATKGRRTSAKAAAKVVETKPETVEGSMEVVGFAVDGEVIGEDGTSVGALDVLLKEEGVETGGWVLLVGSQPHVPEGWEEVVNAPGSRKKRRRS